METPSYIKTLITPQAKAVKTARRVWSIDLESVWLPFFHATNVMGDTAIPSEALGAPLRLAIGKDGAVRFNQSGKPIIRVARDLSDMVRLIRENFTAGLMSYTNGVATENPEGYKDSVMTAHEAGKPIIQHDTALLANALAKQAEAEATAKAKAVAEAEAIAKARKPKARKVKAEATPEPSTPEPDKVPELVTA